MNVLCTTPVPALNLTDVRGNAYGYTTTAPSSVHAGETFQATITLDPTAIPAQQQGYTLKGLVEAHHIQGQGAKLLAH